MLLSIPSLPSLPSLPSFASLRQKPKFSRTEKAVSQLPLPSVLPLRSEAGDSVSVETYPVISETAWASRLTYGHLQARHPPVSQDEARAYSQANSLVMAYSAPRPAPVPPRQSSSESHLSPDGQRSSIFARTKSVWLPRRRTVSDLYQRGRKRISGFAGQLQYSRAPFEPKNLTTNARPDALEHNTLVANTSPEQDCPKHSHDASSSLVQECTRGDVSAGKHHALEQHVIGSANETPGRTNTMRRGARNTSRDRSPPSTASHVGTVCEGHGPCCRCHHTEADRARDTCASTPELQQDDHSPVSAVSSNTNSSLQQRSTTTTSPPRACLHECYIHTECLCSVTRVVYCSCPVKAACLETSLDDRRGLTVLTEMKYFLNPICHECLMQEVRRDVEAKESEGIEEGLNADTDVNTSERP